MSLAQSALQRMNAAPPGFSIERDLPAGFAAFYRTLHERFTPRQRALSGNRKEMLAAAHAGRLPTYLPPSQATTSDWKIELPAWCADQRNQMTGPADEADLVVKMLNSGAPGVMLDLEDSMANEWEHLMLGIDNVIAALYGELTYDDKKRGETVAIKPSTTVTWTRVRGLHLSQAGIYSEPTSASLFDLALLVFRLDLSRLRHPLCIYIPSRRKRRFGGATCWASLRRTKASRAITSSAWRSARRIRSHSSSRSLPTICATICWGSTWGAGITWRA